MATSIVTIDAPDKVVTCDAEGKTQHVFNVKNTSDRALTIGAKVLVGAPTQQEWLHVEAPAEQELAVNVLTQIPVRIQVPVDCKAGRYTYRLLVYSVRKAGEEFTEGEAVAFEVTERAAEAPPPPTPRCRWCIPVAIFAAVLVIGGVLAWAFWPEGKPEIVSFVADPASVTAGEKTTLNWNVENAQQVEISGLGQVQPSGSRSVDPTKDGAEFTLTANNSDGKKTSTADVHININYPPVRVPRLIGQNLDVALSAITRAGFTFDANNLKRRSSGDANVGKVVAQQPQSGTSANKGSEIVLWVGQSQQGYIIPKGLVLKLKQTQPSVYSALIKDMPRSVEPADD